jgi:DNA-binding beta-propeller fold protein YncE
MVNLFCASLAMRSICRRLLHATFLAMFGLAFACGSFIFAQAQTPVEGTTRPAYFSPLATGLKLDPVGSFVDLGSMPLAMALSPDGNSLVVVLSGWREQGIQVVDLKSMRVTQTLEQPSAFYGLAFSGDGRELYVSGGNEDAIFCYSWKDGVATFTRKIALAEKKPDKPGTRYPAGLAASRRGNLLYVAENVANSLAVVDPGSGQVVQRLLTDHYPYAVAVARDGRVYVSAWGAQTVSIFRQRADGTLITDGRLKVGFRPSALLANASGSRLYVALAGIDQIAVVDTRQRRVLRTLSDAAPGGPSEGSTPNALALSQDESKLYVAEADNNAVAVFAVSAERSESDLSAEKSAAPSAVALVKDRLLGRVPTDWYPTAVLETGKQLLILTGKGHGSHANPDGPIPGKPLPPLGYALGMLNGTLRTLPSQLSASTLAQYSQRVAAANNWGLRQAKRAYPPFKHVLYIIKENRTYDQVFGDLPQGDGDASLLFFGKDSTPNHRALALRFGLFDRFFTNAEVSSQGHIWSTAAYVTDYGEKTVPSVYSDRHEDVDGEDSDEPADGFLWTLAAKKGIWFRDYGEMVNIPDGGWPVTQKELVADVCPTYIPFDMKTTDQKRADAWIAELNQFVQDGAMPQLEVMHLAGDHTAGGRAGLRTPRAFVADNDLALGRIVEALSKSPFWKDTVVFVVEDDAQAGPDHVDAHRAPFLAISAYSRPGTVHRFANTTDVVAAIEDILGLGRLSKFDYFSRSLANVFAATPELTPYQAVTPTANMEELNPAKTAAAILSQDLDFSRPDRVNDELFNRILWLMIKSDQPAPPMAAKAPLQVLQMSR